MEVADKAGRMLEQILPDIKKTAELVQEISAASKEQSVGTEQINRAIIQLDGVIQQNASASEEMSAAAEQLSGQSGAVASTAEELASQADRLRQAIAFFKLNGSAASRRLLEDARRASVEPEGRVPRPETITYKETAKPIKEQPLLTAKDIGGGGNNDNNQPKAVSATVARHESSAIKAAVDEVDKDFEEY